MVDDMERIRYYRNELFYENFLVMKILKFNEIVLEFIWVIVFLEFRVILFCFIWFRKNNYNG